MNGKFFKLTYNSIIKIIQAEKTFEEYLSGISKAFSLPMCVIRELTGAFIDKDGDKLLINTEMDYGIMLEEMKRENIRTLKITLGKEKAQDQYTQSSEFEVIHTTESQDMNIQTDEVISKHAQIQTDQTKQPEVKEGTCQTNTNTKAKKKNTLILHRSRKHQEGTLEYEKDKARREVRRKFREEFRKFKKQALAKLYEESDMEVEKRYKEIIGNSPTCQCRGCGMNPIVGNMYKCSQCANVYYCELCEEKLSLNHGHCFIKFRPKLHHQKQLFEIDFLQKIKQGANYANQIISQQTCLFANYIKSFNPLNLINTSNNNYLASCTNKTLDIISKNNKCSQKVVLNLKNDGNINWPTPCFLSCNENSSVIKGDDVEIHREVAPNETISVIITLDLTNIKTSGCCLSLWQLESETREKFGNAFALRIHCSFDNELAYVLPEQDQKNDEFVYVSTNNLIQSYESFAMAIKPDYNKLVEEMKKEYNLTEDKYVIMNALIFAKGNKQAAYQNVINKRNNICKYHKI